MIAFLISLLVLLLYAAIAVLIIYLLFFFYEKIFGQPVPGRAQQIIWAIIGLIFCIWFLQSLFTGTQIPAPWSLR